MSPRLEPAATFEEEEQRCEHEWWPALRARYPDPSDVPEAERTPDQVRMGRS